MRTPVGGGFSGSDVGVRVGDVAHVGLAEEGEHGVDASVLGGVGGEIELAQDAADMRFDGLAGDVEQLGDAAVGASLGEEGEHVAFAWGECGERVAGGWYTIG